MAHYENAWGDWYEDEEEVWDEIHETMNWDDYEDYFTNAIGFSKLFQWARQQPDFYDHFENEFCDAESAYFTDNYRKVEDDEEEEE